MKKQIMISIAIVLIVIILNIITQKYTETAMGEILENLEKTRNNIIGQKEEKEIVSNIGNTIEKWNEKKEKMVIYLEHTELEKAEMYLLEAKSYIETKEYTMAVQSLDTCKFIIDHIIDKYEFSLKNIF